MLTFGLSKGKSVKKRIEDDNFNDDLGLDDDDDVISDLIDKSLNIDDIDSVDDDMDMDMDISIGSDLSDVDEDVDISQSQTPSISDSDSDDDLVSSDLEVNNIILRHKISSMKKQPPQFT